MTDSQIVLKSPRSGATEWGGLRGGIDNRDCTWDVEKGDVGGCVCVTS